jgi:hypothetical protein
MYRRNYDTGIRIILFGIYIFVSQRVEIVELAMLLDFGMSGKLHAQ